MSSSRILRVLCISILGLGLGLGGSAAAMTLVPQTEGEVDVGLAGGPLGGVYLGIPLNILSLVDSSTGLASHLFVDRAGTANTYGPVNFLSADVGTSDPLDDFWFRPAVVQTPALEDGQLEAGTFLITFGTVVPELVVRFFDTEADGTAYAVNGGDVTAVPAGSDGNIYELTLFDVSSLILDLGERDEITGDGVSFQLHASESVVEGLVPEPTSASLLGVALAALAFAARRRA